MRTSISVADGAHWAAEEVADDDDMIVFLIPPLPTYAAPPPPSSASVAPSKSAENVSSNISVRRVAGNFERTTQSTDAPKPALTRVHRPVAPSAPARPLPPMPVNKIPAQVPKKRPRSGSFGDQPFGAAPSRPVPPSITHLPPLPERAPPPVPKHVVPQRANSVSATFAALPEFESHPKYGALPPLPSSQAPLRPSRITSEYSIKPSLLVPVLPTVSSGGSANASPRDTSPSSAPSSTSPSPRTMTHSLPAIIGTSLSARASTSSRGRSDSKGVVMSGDSVGSGGSGTISAPNRPNLRIDDSISDNRVIQEMVITHEDYVKDLHLIRSVFMIPMKERGIVSSDVHSIFFDGIGDIIREEEAVLRDMVGKKLQPLDMAHIYQSHMKSLQVYIPFCARQDQTLKLMTEQLGANLVFSTFCDDVRKDPNCRGLSFDAFIIKPLQRLCKLPLLFRELLKGLAHSTPAATASPNNEPSSTSASVPNLNTLSLNSPPHASPTSNNSSGGASEERRQLEAAQQGLENILDEINKSTGNAEKIIELERNLIKKYPQIESLNLQHRKLLLDGDIAWVVKQTKDQAKLRPGHFWLLDQLLLFCRSPKELDFIMPLNTVSISKHLPAVQNFPYVFELSDMTVQGLVVRKLCLSDRDLYDTLLLKLQ